MNYACDRVGKRSLATMLLDYEPLAIDQVPLLLSMGESGRALAKACESGDAVSPRADQLLDNILRFILPN